MIDQAWITEQKQEFKKALEQFQYYVALGHADKDMVAQAQQHIKALQQKSRALS